MTEPSAHFLDAGQYSAESIGKYQRIYGRDFISPGGAEAAREFIGMLELSPGQRVLDAGCGIGGAAFLMADECGVTVEGIDLSRNMIGLAMERCRALGLEAQVTFRHGDLMALEADRHFDAVYSRDVFLHVDNKPALFDVLLRALRPGGRLLITDYCRGTGSLSRTFENYVKARGYFLTTLDEYGRALRNAGFGRVRVVDMTARFAEIHARELERLEQSGQAAEDLSDLAAAWREKRDRALKGEQRWGLFTAVRPE
ncbi:MAG TPA: methyltransferase domain-containing protein [Gammaproteobacteria bacterium]|nr:methyltransferase domain-containing protein [Gammaproteobacteria bacterium]